MDRGYRIDDSFEWDIEERASVYQWARGAGYEDADWEGNREYFYAAWRHSIGMDGGTDNFDERMDLGASLALADPFDDACDDAVYEEDGDDDDEGGMYAGLGAADWEDDEGCDDDSW